MGMPSLWHRRQALMLAGQLPENPEDARMVILAVTELLETFLAKGGDQTSQTAATTLSKVLPFLVG